MDIPARPSTTGTPVEHLAAQARLGLPPERAEPVARMLDDISTLIDQLDELDLAETPMATAFDARWD